MTGTEAASIMEAELSRAGHPTRSSFKVQSLPNTAGLVQAWWSENLKANERSENARTLGYFRAYVRIADQGLLRVDGLPLEPDHYLWMDRSVMKRLERDDYLRWSHDTVPPHFEITPKGARFLIDGLELDLSQ